MSTCTNCGAPLAADARFCPKCGTAVAVAPPPPVVNVPPAAVPQRVPYTPAPPPLPAKAGGKGTWWIVPLIVVGIVLIAWLLLAGLPFRRGEKPIVAAAPATETIAEGTAPAAGPPETGTIVDVTETAPPPLATATAPAPPAQTEVPVDTPLPPPVVVDEPVRRTPPPAPSRPIPVPPKPVPAPVPAEKPVPAPAETAPNKPAGEITEGEAAATLRGFVTSRNYYSDVASGCIQVRNQGYRNVGYTFSVWDACVSGGGSRMLGRWRVDAKTREVFRQQEDGRYLRP
jgi:hypothetical protein